MMNLVQNIYNKKGYTEVLQRTSGVRQLKGLRTLISYFPQFKASKCENITSTDHVNSVMEYL